MVENSIIETGVDKLVNLINSKSRGSSMDAAKELGVSVTVIMEWADFLEEEGIINVEYKFTKPFLVARKLAKKEVQEKAREFTGKKEVFIRKAEGSLSFLEKESSKLNAIKDEFDRIKKELGFDLSAVKSELEELEKYEKLKIGLDQKIEDQKKDSIEKIETMAKQVEREKRKYDEMLKEIRSEEKSLEREKSEAKSLEDSERFIRERLKSLKDIISKVEGKLTKEEESVKHSEDHIQKLVAMAKSVKESMEREKSLIEPLIRESQDQSRKIRDLQQKVLAKIEQKGKMLEGAKKASRNLKDIFSKKASVISMVDKANKDRNELQRDLVELIKKAKSFQLSSKTADVGSQIVDLERKFSEVDSKKKEFEKELKKLGSALTS